MTKVCHMTSVHKSCDSRIYKKECISLAEAGYDVYIVAQGDSYNINDIHIIGVGEKPNSRFKRITSFTKSVYKKALKINADIYHIHDPELLPYGVKLKKAGKKVIFDSHEFYSIQIKEKEYLPKFMRKIISKVYSLYEDFVLKKIDAIIIPCTLNGKNIFEGKIRHSIIIGNCPRLSDFYNLYEENDLKKNNTCYTGSITKDRGITQALKAAHKENKKLLIAGTFNPSSYHLELKQLPEYTSLDYRGILDSHGLVEIYKNSNIGICTLLNIGQYNKGDNFATKVYEYMSMGLPVIISDSQYAKNIMNEYKFGICVNPNNVNDIADAIKFINNNPREAIDMGNNGRFAVLNKFNWNYEEIKLLSLYKELLTPEN